MKRRAFIAGCCGTAALMSLGVAAQPQSERLFRIGALLYAEPTDPEVQAELAAFTRELERLGWIDGRNIRLEVRWARGENGLLRSSAAELIAGAADVIVAGSAAARAVLDETSDAPVIFVNVADPVGLGFVSDLAHPGGHVTGFYNYDFDMGGKWLETLKDLAPGLSHVAILGNEPSPAYRGWLDALRAVAGSFGVRVAAPAINDASDIERSVREAASEPGGGLIVLPGSLVSIHRDLIIELAQRHKLPGIYPRKDYSELGGLASYGVDISDLYRRAAAYVDRILRGTKPGDLPVQGPTKFELVINLKTAAQLGLAVPQSLRLLANELIR